MIAAAVKESEKREEEATLILNSFGLTHSFSEGSFNSESSIKNNKNEEFIFMKAKRLYAKGNQYSFIENDNFLNTLDYYEIVFLDQKITVEVERSSSYDIIKLLNDNAIFVKNGLSEKAIEKFKTKYGTNRFSSLVTTTTNIIIR